MCGLKRKIKGEERKKTGDSVCGQKGKICCWYRDFVISHPVAYVKYHNFARLHLTKSRAEST
jgi:hypothetical protein